MLHRLLMAAAALMVLATVTPGRAGEREAEARRHFDVAARSYREARYKDAIDEFLKAYDAEPMPELIFNVGQAYEKLGDVPNALRSYRDYLRLSPAAPDKATVEASIRNLERRLGEKGVQQVTVFSSPPGASVSLDGRKVGVTPWTGEILQGRHVVTLSMIGYPDTAKEILLTGNRSMDIDVTLGLTGTSSASRTAEVTARDGALPAAQPQRHPSPNPPARSVSLPTWLTLGAGAALLGTSAGFELARRGAESDARSAATQIAYKEELDRMESRQTTARVLLGVGLATAAVGGVLLYLDLRPTRQAREGQVAIGLGCSAGLCGASAAGAF